MKSFSHFVLFLAFISTATMAVAQPAGYYSSAQGLTGSALRSALHNIIDNHNSQSYNSLWNHFEDTDAKPNGKVWDMYSDNPGGTPPYQFSFGSDKCGTYHDEGDCYNREHSWPKSWFNDGYPMYTDLFHLYPTDGKVNGMRSNHPFGEVGSATWVSENGSKLGYCSYPGYSGIVFEPIDEYKGDFARTYFYMCTRYYGEDSGWESNAMINGANLKTWALNMMLEWHVNDPVSQKEIDRNNAVYQIQGNRNPFIDNPNYAQMIWDPTWSGGTYQITLSAGTGGTISPSGTQTVSEGADLTFTVTPNSCHEINIVKVNNVAVALNYDNTYTIQNIHQNTTVNATFASSSGFMIASSCNGGGTISPSGNVTVNCGTNKTFSITADEGYMIANVVVDGTAKGIISTYTFTNVQSDHTINAVFVEEGEGCQPTQNVYAEAGIGNVSVSWDMVPNATDYEIYRDGNHIAMISGTTTYTDSNVSAGTHCYSVVTYCIDGISERSAETCTDVNVGLNETGNAIAIYPNPIGKGQILYISSDSPMDRIRITDLSGRTLAVEYVEEAETASIELPRDIQAGFYLISISDNNQQDKITKLIIR